MFVAPLQRVISRERSRIRAEVLRFHGLMPLLMKQRNGQRWSWQDVAAIRVSLKDIAAVSAILTIFLLPGSFILLPPLAWWLDRRNQTRGIERNTAAR